MSQEDPHGAPSSGMSNFSIRLTAHSSLRNITLIRFDRAGPLETLSESPTAWTRTPASTQWITRQAHGRFTVDCFYKQWGVADPIPVRDGWQTSMYYKKRVVICTVVALSGDVTFEMSVELTGEAPTLIQPSSNPDSTLTLIPYLCRWQPHQETRRYPSGCSM